MRLHGNLLTAAVLAVALAGCNLPKPDQQVQHTNPVPQSTNPIATNSNPALARAGALPAGTTTAPLNQGARSVVDTFFCQAPSAGDASGDLVRVSSSKDT